MSNKRIDLHDDSLLKQIREHEEKYHNPTHGEVDTILHCAKGIGLIDELSRCYAVIEEAQEYVRHLTATPDVLTMRLGKDLTIDNLRMSLEGLLVLLGADERSGYGSHSSEPQNTA